ncbi:MAG: glycine C-acetyltransferase, partial [Planctomycetota bacterium]
MYGTFQAHLQEQLAEIESAGLNKAERVITTPQSSSINVSSGEKVLNFCANNYLGLADNEQIQKSAQDALENWGYGLASVRFICGTQQLHKNLEERLSGFLGTEDTILYSSCFDANGGLFETLLTAEDAIISDELNHASIIDGVRLCKANRYRYKNNDMQDLEEKLKAASEHRFKLIATDGVFSMDGTIADLPSICELADKYQALVMVDDSHAVGFMGKHGKGTHEHHDVIERIDITTGTFGKALGGASGGYTSGRKEIVSMLRQRSRPYLFSNSLAPPIAAGTLAALDLLQESTALRDKLEENTKFFRSAISQIGLEVIPGEHPIVPIMLGDAKLANQFADYLLGEGIYVIGFSYPVVPKG